MTHMAKYEVEIVESVSHVFTVEAENEEKAKEKSMEIHKGAIEHDPDDDYSHESIESKIVMCEDVGA